MTSRVRSPAPYPNPSSASSSSSSLAGLPMYGEAMCRATYGSGKACRARAYFACGNSYALRCGTHSKMGFAVCRELRKPSVKEKEANGKATRALALAHIEAARASNRAAGRRGEVTLRRMAMMKPIAHTPGAETVFPNNKHAGRTDGVGMATLSPMRLGPVVHGQVGLPNALNLENAYQFVSTSTPDTDALPAASSTGISKGNICTTCRGQRPHAGGYGWRYLIPRRA